MTAIGHEDVALALEGGGRLTAEALARSGAWAAHRDVRCKGWRVSHVPTGRALLHVFATVEDACAAAALLGARAPEWARDAAFGEQPEEPLPACAKDVAP